MTENIEIKRAYLLSEFREIREIYNNASEIIKEIFCPKLLTKYNKLLYFFTLLGMCDFFVAKENNRVVGFIYVKDDVLGMMVEKDHRRKGIGLALIKHIQERFKRLYLVVNSSNIPAFFLYQKAGFKIKEYSMKWEDVSRKYW